MLVIEDNNIKLTRGDTMRLTVNLTDSSGETVILGEGDSLFFRLKKSAKNEELLINKYGDVSQMLLELDESDTKDLPFGRYKYEIEVVYSGDHYTIIENKDFTIGEELENHNG